MKLDYIKVESGNGARLGWSTGVRVQRWIWDFVMGLTEGQIKCLVREAYYDLLSESSREGCGRYRFKSRLDRESREAGLAAAVHMRGPWGVL